MHRTAVPVAHPEPRHCGTHAQKLHQTQPNLGSTNPEIATYPTQDIRAPMGFIFPVVKHVGCSSLPSWTRLAQRVQNGKEMERDGNKSKETKMDENRKPTRVFYVLQFPAENLPVLSELPCLVGIAMRRPTADRHRAQTAGRPPHCPSGFECA